MAHRLRPALSSHGPTRMTRPGPRTAVPTVWHARAPPTAEHPGTWGGSGCDGAVVPGSCVPSTGVSHRATAIPGPRGARGAELGPCSSPHPSLLRRKLWGPSSASPKDPGFTPGALNLPQRMRNRGHVASVSVIPNPHRPGQNASITGHREQSPGEPATSPAWPAPSWPRLVGTEPRGPRETNGPGQRVGARESTAPGVGSSVSCRP